MKRFSPAPQAGEVSGFRGSSVGSVDYDQDFQLLQSSFYTRPQYLPPTFPPCPPLPLTNSDSSPSNAGGQVMCDAFRKGNRCELGVNCPNLHRALIAVPSIDKASSVDRTPPHMSPPTPTSDLQTVVLSAEPQQKATEKRQKNPCFEWEKGRCRKGDKCRYYHDIKYAPKTPPTLAVPEDPETILEKEREQERKAQEVREKLQKIVEQRKMKSPKNPSAWGGAPGKGATKKRRDKVKPVQVQDLNALCVQWEKGNCSEGDKCRFKHSERDINGRALCVPKIEVNPEANTELMREQAYEKLKQVIQRKAEENTLGQRELAREKSHEIRELSDDSEMERQNEIERLRGEIQRQVKERQECLAKEKERKDREKGDEFVRRWHGKEQEHKILEKGEREQQESKAEDTRMKFRDFVSQQKRKLAEKRIRHAEAKKEQERVELEMKEREFKKRWEEKENELEVQARLRKTLKETEAERAAIQKQEKEREEEEKARKFKEKWEEKERLRHELEERLLLEKQQEKDEKELQFKQRVEEIEMKCKALKLEASERQREELKKARLKELEEKEREFRLRWERWEEQKLQRQDRVPTQPTESSSKIALEDPPHPAVGITPRFSETPPHFDALVELADVHPTYPGFAAPSGPMWGGYPVYGPPVSRNKLEDFPDSVPVHAYQCDGSQTCACSVCGSLRGQTHELSAWRYWD